MVLVVDHVVPPLSNQGEIVMGKSSGGMLVIEVRGATRCKILTVCLIKTCFDSILRNHMFSELFFRFVTTQKIDKALARFLAQEFELTVMSLDNSI